MWLAGAATAARRLGFVVADDVNVAARRDAQLDLMADLLATHLDITAIIDLMQQGLPPRPTVVSTLST
jgi:adenosylcobyric acid synthase